METVPGFNVEFRSNTNVKPNYSLNPFYNLKYKISRSMLLIIDKISCHEIYFLNNFEII